MTADTINVIVDTREPWPHPWRAYLPPTVTMTRATLSTGDFTLTEHFEDVAVERKTVSDLLTCIGTDRDRFERELQRAADLAAFCVVVEGSLPDLLRQRREIHPNAIMGTLAAWTRRHCPIVFAGSPMLATMFTVRYLAGHLRDTPPQSKESPKPLRCGQILTPPQQFSIHGGSEKAKHQHHESAHD
jgi:ERCC4-type nuclease